MSRIPSVLLVVLSTALVYSTVVIRPQEASAIFIVTMTLANALLFMRILYVEACLVRAKQRQPNTHEPYVRRH